MGDTSSQRSWFTSFLRRHGFPLLSTGFAVFQLIYLGVFTQGFFLTRYEIPTKQTCQPPGNSFQGDSSSSHSSSSTSLSAASCWFPRQYDRVVILMVDALRFDFLYYNSSIEPAKRESTLPYVNELPAINQVLTSPVDRSHASLFRFVADPPTVTMQRIKGLTTGGLPTFIDIANNFGGAVITEDNWISQLVNSQRWRSNGGIANATQSNVMNFFGDDTWFDLYPPVKHFSSKSTAYPSFNVKDLHTVDNGCLKHLEPMLAHEMNRLAAEEAELNGNPVPKFDAQEEDWDVTLAHFLGVDHVGHRYGPNHPEMRLKLTQMNGVFSRNIDYIRHQRKVNELIRAKKAKGQKVEGSGKEQEVLFIVMGDHGMTSEGNHGGQSAEEIYAGLFMYSTKHINQQVASSASSSKNEGRFFEEVRANNEASMSSFAMAAGLSDNGAFSLPPLSNSFTSFQSIPQVDFVPTLSLLLGLPIPFGNIGKIIPELFWGRDSTSPELASAGGGDDALKRSLVIERIESFQPLLHAIHMNALQISTYFFKYAELVGAKNFDSTFLHENGQLKTTAEDVWKDIKATVQGGSWKSKASLEELRALEQKCVRAYIDFHKFLTRSAAFAQAKWTNFTLSSMNFGVAILALLAASVAAFILNANKAYLIQLLQLSSSASSSTQQQSNFKALHKSRFVHPMYALFKSMLIVFPLVLAPMHLLTSLPLTSQTSRDQPQDDLFEITFNFIKANELWIAASCTLLFGLLVSLRNLSQKMTWLREFSSSYPSEANALGLSRWSWPSIQGVVAGVVAAVYIQGQFSNSFIVAEGNVVLYSAAMLAFSWLFGTSSSNSSNSATINSSSASWSSVGWLALLLVSMRSMSFASSNTAPDANFMDINKYNNQDVVFMIIALVLLQIFSVYTARVLLKPFTARGMSTSSAVMGAILKGPANQQALKRISLYSALHFILIPLSITLIFLFWSLQSPTYPPSVSESILSWVFDPLWAAHDHFLLPLQFLFGVNPVDDKRWLVRVACPRAVYIIAVGGILALFVYPVRLFTASSESKGTQNGNSHKRDEHGMDDHDPSSEQENDGHQLRRRKDVSNSSVAPSTPVSSESSNAALTQSHLSHLRSRLLALSWFSFLSLLSLPLMLVWGPKSSVVILNCWCVGIALVKLLPKDSNNSNRSPTLNLSAYIFILFLSLHLFYSTGHTNAFSSLQVSCAFIGFDIFNFYVGGLLLMLNTFGHVILALGISIIVGCVCRAQSEKQHAEASEKAAASSAGSKISDDFSVPASQANAILHFQQMSLSWLLCLTFCRTLFSTLNVYLHRRHLMVWAIFAPKYMFDAVFNVALDVICVLFAMATARWTQ